MHYPSVLGIPQRIRLALKGNLLLGRLQSGWVDRCKQAIVGRQLQSQVVWSEYSPKETLQMIYNEIEC